MTTKPIDREALAKSASADEYRDAGGDLDSSGNQRIRSDLVRREVVYCVSSLVSHFASNSDALEGSGYSYDDVLDLCQNRPDPSDWDIDQCRQWLEDNGHEYGSLDDESDESEWQECVSEAASDEPGEIYEHWIVSGWLAEQLAKRGETTTEDFFGMTIWGRGCTGQSIMLDYVIGDIAAEMGILEGQRHEWKT